MANKRIAAALIALGLLAGAALPCTAEEAAYTTYQYTYSGVAVACPHAYVPERYLSGEKLGVGALSDPQDMVADGDGNLYISDSGHDRVIVLDSALAPKAEIRGITENGEFSDKDGSSGWQYLSYESRAAEYADFAAVYGGLFFLGVTLSLVFI